MPSTRLIGALLLSVALIGGALWFRFTNLPPYSADLISVQDFSEFASEEAFLSDFLATTSPARPFSNATLSQTELVSRQLFTDYMGLKSRGQISPEEILSLADQYAVNIVRTEIASTEVSLNQLVTVANTEENLAHYGEVITNIRSKYKALTSTRYPGGQLTDINNRVFASFLVSAGELYGLAANELLAVRVPISLAQNHLEIVNGYFANAAALKLLAETSENPMGGYAAFNFYVKNIEKETSLMIFIQQTLIAYGIGFNNNI